MEAIAVSAVDVDLHAIDTTVHSTGFSNVSPNAQSQTLVTRLMHPFEVVGRACIVCVGSACNALTLTKHSYTTGDCTQSFISNKTWSP